MTPLRERAAQALSGSGAFLRVDRGNALYLTDLPRRAPDALGEAARRLMEAGLDIRPVGTLFYLTPNGAARAQLNGWVESMLGAPGELAASLQPLTSRAAEPEEDALWLWEVKLLELGARPGERRACEDALRRRAAVCLRTGRGGGGLYACARLLECMDAGGTRKGENAR